MTKRAVILLSEPDAALCASLRFALELRGYDVELVERDRLAEAALRPIFPACVIVGDRPRAAEGLRLAAELRLRGCFLPIVVLMTNPSRAAFEQARRCDAILIEKPLLGDALIDTLTRLFETNDAA